MRTFTKLGLRQIYEQVDALAGAKNYPSRAAMLSVLAIIASVLIWLAVEKYL